MNSVKDGYKYLAAGVDVDIKTLGNVKTEPDRSYIIGRSCTEPTVGVVGCGTGFCHDLEFSYI